MKVGEMDWFWEEFAEIKELFEKATDLEATGTCEDKIFLNFLRFKLDLPPIPGLLGATNHKGESCAQFQ